MTQPYDVKSGASLLNSVKNSETSFTGSWEDVKDYNSVIVTLQSPKDGSGALIWANPTRRLFPTDTDIIARETFSYSATAPKTLQWDNRGRWFKLEYTDTGSNPTDYSDFSLNIETLLKGAATELKIGDDGQNIVHLHSGDSTNAYHTVYTDISGTPLATTDDNTAGGEALYVGARDASNNHLATTNTTGLGPESLFVAFRDNNNDSIATSTDGNALHVHTGDESGYSQAAAYTVSGSHTGDKALFLSLADSTGSNISSTLENTDTNNVNALYVQLTLSGGDAVARDKPLPCTETSTLSNMRKFDIQYGIRANTYSTTSDLSDGTINLHDLFTYNDGPTTVWTKLYDMSVGYFDPSAAVSTYESRVLFSVATPAGGYRDFKFPRGLLFNEGLHFRSSTEPDYNGTTDPGEDVLFVNGAYYKNASEDVKYFSENEVPYGSRSLEGDNFAEAPVADFAFPFAFSEPEPEPEPEAEPEAEAEAEAEPEVAPPLTGLEDLDTEPVITDKTIAFQAEGDNHIKGSVTFSYNEDEELLSLSTMINSSAQPPKELDFCYEEIGNPVQYGIDITGLTYGSPLTTENINITPEQLESAKVVITLDNDMEVNIAYNGV